MSETKKAVEQAGVTPAKPKPISVPLRWLREIVAIAVWSTAVTHLLVFDVLGGVAALLPSLATLVRFRFLFLLGTTSVLWLILGNRRFALLAGYIVGYPFVVVLWKIPLLLFKKWPLLVAFSPAVHSIVTTFRFTFVRFSAALIAAFLVCLASNKVVVAISMAVLATYLLVHFYRRFRVAYAPSTVFADVSSAIRAAWDAVTSSETARAPSGLNPASAEYKQRFGQNLLMLHVMTTGLYFIGERLRETARSRVLDLYFLGSLVYTFVLTSVVFAVEYLGLERLVPGSFVGVARPGFVQFLGLSFGTLMTAEISPLRASSSLAQIALYSQLVGSLMIGILLVFVILTSIRERYKQDLDGVVDELRTASERIGKLVEENFELTAAGAEAWLLRFNPVVTRWCLKLRYGEKRAAEIAEVAGKES